MKDKYAYSSSLREICSASTAERKCFALLVPMIGNTFIELCNDHAIAICERVHPFFWASSFALASLWKFASDPNADLTQNGLKSPLFSTLPEKSPFPSVEYATTGI